MRGLLGLVLLAIGLSLGAYSHYPGAAERHQTLSELTHIVTGSVALTTLRSKGRDASSSDGSGPASRAPSMPGAQTEGAPSQAPTSPNMPARKQASTTADGSTVDVNTDDASKPSGQAAPVHNAAASWFADRLAQALGKIEGSPDAAVTSEPSQVAAQPQEPGRPALTAKRSSVSPPAAAKVVAAHEYTPRQAPVRIQAPGWKTAVVRVKTEAETPHSGRVNSLKPKTGTERWQLVKKIQTELKRVGCYWGKVDGVWGRGSKRAIKAFMTSVNAALPHKQPDYLLLSLLEGQRTAACMAPCGPGKLRAASGQCITPEIVAQGPTGNRQHTWTTRVVEAQDVLQTKVAIANSAVRKAVPRRVANLDQGARLTTGTINRKQQEPNLAPLPGRMAVGAADRIKIGADEKLFDRGAGAAAPALPSLRKADADRASNKRPAKRLKISALPDPVSGGRPIPVRGANQDTSTDEAVARQQNAAAVLPNSTPNINRVTVRRLPAQAVKRKAVKKASAAKKSRTYRRRYRARSVQSLFTHPLGRM